MFYGPHLPFGGPGIGSGSPGRSSKIFTVTESVRVTFHCPWNFMDISEETKLSVTVKFDTSAGRVWFRSINDHIPRGILPGTWPDGSKKSSNA